MPSLIVPLEEMMDKNIPLAFDLLAKCLEDPSQSDVLPDGASIVLMPQDNLRLSEANLAMGVQAVKEGANVFFLHV